MNSGVDIRGRLLKQVAMMLQRPGMFSNHDQPFEAMCSMRLADLRFLDGLDEPTRSDLGLGDKYGPCGVPGPFWEVFGRESRCYNEVASVYAEIFHRFGYLTPERTISPADWAVLLTTADSEYTGTDTHLSMIMETFGPPSFKVGRWVLCYAPEDGSGWVFFDGSDHVPDIYDAATRRFSGGFPSDPFLRNVRLPGKDFKQSLRLTPHGEALQHRAHVKRLA